MKIDDPDVEAYIKGELSFEKEESFREKLQGFPEVADLAETLKAAAARMDSKDESEPIAEMDSTSENLSQPPTESLRERLFDDSEIPEKGLPLFFHGIMGKSWRFGVVTLGVTSTALIILFVVIPFVRSLNQMSNSNSLSEFEKQVKKLEAKKNLKYIQEKSSKVDSSFRAAGSNKEMQDISEIFKTMLAAPLSSISSEDASVITEYVKAQSGFEPRKSNETSFSLPLKFETKLASEITVSIQDGKRVDPLWVDPESFLNSFIDSGASSHQVSVKAHWETSPWDKSVILLVTEVALGTSEQNPLVDKIHFILVDLSLESFRSILKQSPPLKPELEFHINEDFKKNVDEALKQLDPKGDRVVFVSEGGLSSIEAQYLNKAMSLRKHVSHSFLALNPWLTEAQKAVRSQIESMQKNQSRQRPLFFQASSPALLQASLRVISGVATRFLEKVSLKLHTNTSVVTRVESFSRGIGPVSGETSPVWMASGERVQSLLALKLKNQSDSLVNLGVLNLNYQLPGEMSFHKLEIELDPAQIRPEFRLSPENYQFASHVTWLGLQLRGDLPVSATSLNKINLSMQGLQHPKANEISQLLVTLEQLYED